MPKQSAGILLYRIAGEDLELLLVHPGGPIWANKDLGAWSIPKGEYEPGDDPQACALREFEEELGSTPPVSPRQLVDLGSITQKSGKVVRAWAAEADFDPTGAHSNTFEMEWPPRSGVRREFPEVDRAEWFRASEAKEKLLEGQTLLVDRLLDQLGD